MKILELEIHNIRGICELNLKPGGKNMVIWGPNGSGKSAVVDAIDFLLTGRISRLAGKGTGAIKLDKHWPHIDHKPEEAWASALIQIPGISKPIGLKRCMANRNSLGCDPHTALSQLQPIISLATRGQHILTRREILKYITAEPGARAQEIQELLNITEVEEIRKALVKVENDCEKEQEKAGHGVKLAESAINATIQQPAFSPELVLQFVNQNRTLLGAEPITRLHSSELKSSVTPPAMLTGRLSTVNKEVLKRDVSSLNEFWSEASQKQILETDTELRGLLRSIRSHPEILQSLKSLKLIELGIELIDDSGACPLCGTSWPPGKLHVHLQERLSEAENASNYQKDVNRLSSQVNSQVMNSIVRLRNIKSAAQSFGLNTEILVIDPWIEDMQALSSELSTPIERYPGPRFGDKNMQTLVAPPKAVEILANIIKTAESACPELTREQKAWDNLTRLEENFKGSEQSLAAFAAAAQSYKRAAFLRSNFILARNAVLKQLYDDVAERFVELYRRLHGVDEKTFSAAIEPKDAGLDIEVDFYGRGIHPPHALHSEGHQDSMGLCLFLSLSERLTGGLIGLVILDDVVMSVDADHRRQVCGLLATSFPNRQFLITTHDKTWANQLRSEGVVDSSGMIEFYNWHVDTGPQVNYETDVWQRIENDLQHNDINAAAARLRHTSEQFFGLVCDSLQAEVVFKLNGRYELGDLMPPAMHQYRKLLRMAETAARSWGDTEATSALQECKGIAESIYKRTNAEQWSVNVNVHYNNWTNFTEKDFLPVFEAFQDLFGLFVCSKCGGMLHLAVVDFRPETLKCNCGQVHWNLVRKGK